MKIKRYVAVDLPQAVAVIRRELGRDAVILSTRRQPRPGWRRWFRRFDLVEVAAAVEDPAPLPRTAPRESRAPSLLPAASAGGPAPVGGTAPPSSQAGAASAAPPAPNTISGDPAPLLDVRETAAAQDLRQVLFQHEIVPAEARAPQPICVRWGTRRLVALVGPTGAGKTTTIAKLAAHMHLQHGWRVALITADTFRVGAVEQLAGYARLLGLPLEVTPTPGALQRALMRVEQVDVVLIDTSGRSHRDARRMQELRSFLQAARDAVQPAADETAWEPDRPVDARPGPGGLEVHLVVAAATRREEVEAVVAAHRPFIDRVLITKLDECASPPEVLAVAAESGLTLSYCTAGQRVPEDLALAWPDCLAVGLAPPTEGRNKRKTG